MQFCDEKRNLVFQIPSPKRASSSRCGGPKRSAWRTGIPAEITELLADHSRIKMGVNIAGDGKKMLNDFKVEVNGLLDINDLARAAHPDGVFETRMISLQRLTFRYLDRHLRKGTERTSNWDGHLSQAQINCASRTRSALSVVMRYRTDAALDTYSTMQIYRRLIGIAEMSDIELDIPAMLQHHTKPPVAHADESKKQPSEPPSPLKNRHRRALATVLDSGLAREEGEEALPIVAASQVLSIKETTVISVC